MKWSCREVPHQPVSVWHVYTEFGLMEAKAKNKLCRELMVKHPPSPSCRSNINVLLMDALLTSMQASCCIPSGQTCVSPRTITLVTIICFEENWWVHHRLSTSLSFNWPAECSRKSTAENKHEGFYCMTHPSSVLPTPPQHRYTVNVFRTKAPQRNHKETELWPGHDVCSLNLHDRWALLWLCFYEDEAKNSPDGYWTGGK